MNKINKKIILILLFSFVFFLIFYSLDNNQNKKVSAGLWTEKEKCVVDPVTEKRFAEYEKGRIPIGETVDEAELFAGKIILELDNISNKADTEQREAENMRIEAEKEIDEVEDAGGLIDLTSKGNNNSSDCVDNCLIVCHCSPTPCYCSYNDEGECKSCSSSCTRCNGIPCPIFTINTVYINIRDYYENIEDLYNIINGPPSIPSQISDSYNEIVKLIEPISTYYPNRWQIINKLLNARIKLEECITGYGFVMKELKTKMRLLSCELALDKIYLGELTVIGFFEDIHSPWPHCYPYNGVYKGSEYEELFDECVSNKDSPECRNRIQDYMDNYFCCEGD